MSDRGDRFESLGLDEGDRDGVVYIPGSTNDRGALMLLFHGFSGNGRGAIEAVRTQAARYGVIVVAPDSRGQTWDILEKGHFGPDLTFINRVMKSARELCEFTQFAVTGISDGASYALCLGPGNDFTTIAFSPGFSFPGEGEKRQPIFISHGTADHVLSFRHAVRIAGSFRERGYPITFHAFDGGHKVPPEVVDTAFEWWLGPI
jgi:phospholipase/carboxylesterase